jgi:hypothetical protein
MRLHLASLGLLGLLVSAPAAADITLRYATEPPSDRVLLIEADGQGRIRAEIAPGQLLIRRGGEIFVVTPGEEGPNVSRLDDFLVIATEMGHAYEASHPIRTPPPALHYRLTERGPEAVGTWQGTRIAVEQIGSRDPAAATEYVVSTDPALAEAGRIANWFFETQGRIQATILRFDREELMTLLRQLIARGTPLRVSGQYRLQSIGADLVPATRFDLPGPVLSRQQLRARQPH